MEFKKSPLKIYNEIMAEEHGADEVVKALERGGCAICFNYDRGYVGGRHELFSAVRQAADSSFFTLADLHLDGRAWEGQLLLVLDGSDDSDTVIKFMEESGIISYVYRIFYGQGRATCIGPTDPKTPCRTEKFTPAVLVEGERVVIDLKKC